VIFRARAEISVVLILLCLGGRVGYKASPKKVLVAVRPGDLHIVSEAFGPEFDLIICHTLKDALANLSGNIGLIACGVRFDNGRMFEFLNAVKAHPETRALPFYLILGAGKGYSKAILQGIKSAATVMGVTEFTDLSGLETKLGKEDAYELLRAVIRKHVMP
jgi:hypothetical protein